MSSSSSCGAPTAIALRAGDPLVTAHDKIGYGRGGVSSITVRGPPASGEAYTTYNFEVADWHTYFVGEAGYWVHNESPLNCKDAFEKWQKLIGPETDGLNAFRIMQVQHPDMNDEVFGALAEQVAKELYPDLDSGKPFFVPGREANNPFRNFYRNHWKKHEAEYAGVYDTPVEYAKRAIELSRTTQSTDTIRVGWRPSGREPDIVWTKVVYDSDTRDFVIKIVNEDLAGQLGTMHRLNPNNMNIDKYVKSQMPVSVKPDGVVD